MILVFGKSKVQLPYVLLLMSIVCVVFNYSIVGPLRITDLLLMLTFLSIIPYAGVKRELFLVIITIVLLLVISLVVGIWKNGVRSPQNVVFAYKLLLPFLPPIIMYHVRWDEKRIRQLHLYLMITFLFLMGWIYAYVILKFLGLIAGAWRPKWPFSETSGDSDGHLYSTYLSMCLIFMSIYWRKVFRIKRRWFFPLIVISLGAILMTGSRTGIVILTAFWLYTIFRGFKIRLKVSKSSLVWAPLIMVVLVFGIGYFIYLQGTVEEKSTTRFLATIGRSFDFGLSEDQSANSRANKFLFSFAQSSRTGTIFGPGMVGMGGNWYDGYIAQMNVLMGGIGVIFMLLLPFLLIFRHWVVSKRNSIPEEFKVFSVALIIYFIANQATEYFLVTRNVIPISVFLTAISLVIFKKAPTPLPPPTKEENA